VNIRAVNNIDLSLLDDQHVKRFNFGEDEEACVMDLMANNEITSTECAGEGLN
jgi:hypothetical protein